MEKLSDSADGQTPLDADEAEGLLPSHIRTQKQLNEWESTNILDARDWALNRTRAMHPATESFVRQLHANMFSATWTWSGAYRKSDKNIGIAWYDIPKAMRDLEADLEYWIANKTFAVDEIAIRAHHRLVFIHPFPNGNGRLARLWADVLIKRLAGRPLDWGSRNFDTGSEDRSKYLSALRTADNGRLEPLLAFCRGE